MRLLAAAICSSMLSLPALAETFPEDFAPLVIKSGKTILLWGVRKGCDDDSAPDFDKVKNYIISPPSLGKLSDGGVGTRFSGTCGEERPVRLIKFTAGKKGLGGVLFGDIDGFLIQVK